MEIKPVRSNKLSKLIQVITEKHAVLSASPETQRLLEVIAVIKQTVKESRSISKNDLLEALENILTLTPRTINLALNIAIETQQISVFTVVDEKGAVKDIILAPSK